MLKAIETRYKGYRFRSRLEARWAVFFDRIGHQWVYEPEGYQLPPYTFDRAQFTTEMGATWGKENDASVINSVADMVEHAALQTLYYLPDFWLPDQDMFAEVKGDLEYEDGDKIIRLANASRKNVMLLRELNQNPLLIVPNDASKNTCTIRELKPIPGRLAEQALHAARSARFEHGEQP